MKKRLFGFTSLFVGLMLILASFVPVQARSLSNGQETCPDGGAWVKVDGLSGTSMAKKLKGE